MNSLRRYGLLFLLAASLEGAGIAFLPGSYRVGALIGLLLAFLAGGVSLFLMARAEHRPLSSALMALTVGFLLRMVLIAVGLLATHHLGGELLACAGAFFLIFVVGQVLEIALMSKSRGTGQAQETHP